MRMVVDEKDCLRRQTQRRSMLESLVEYTRATKFSFLTEWLLAWIVVVCVSILHCIHYFLEIMRTALLKRTPNQWCHAIPITALPQTRPRRAVSTRVRLKQLTSIFKDESCGDDKKVLQLLRTNFMARNLASLIMASCTAELDGITKEQHSLVQQLQRVWPSALEIPREENVEYQYEISLIIPAFKEPTENVQRNLIHAQNNAKHPNQIQVVVVDAGGCCPDLSERLQLSNGDCSWGKLNVITHTAGGGRGSTLNFGASHAKGKVLTFLHSDTVLPKKWDMMIRKALANDKKDEQFTHACAFKMAINLTSQGLDGGRCPPGILGAGYAGWLRCQLCSLPFGDSALSFPAHFFNYIGGYPDQPLMEDYEIMVLLRKRARVLDNERLLILPAEAKCSPRRWQVNGVVYTQLVNALCVHRYKHGAAAEDLFKLYYRPLTKKTA